MAAPQDSAKCDFDVLRQSFDDRLCEAREESLMLHLADCARCRRELERLAAQEQDWTRISEALKQESESNATRRFSLHNETPQFDQDDIADDLIADFAVDFLEPGTSAESIGRLADIEILEVIGRGGMGIVLKGYQAELKRLVAVKVLAPHLAVSGAARRRFAREAQAVAAIMHPNVMPILTVHSGGRLPYLVMPFLSCESLQQRILAAGPMDLVDVLRIGMQTAVGLAAAHAQGIVHRDVKPANILLERCVNRVMLTDFGLARTIDDANITRSGVIAGTPQYMSPEQARGESLDARSDLFSLGSVLYVMATGRSAFRAESTYGILRRITDQMPRPIREINPQIPVWLTLIVNRLLAKSPADRFGSAAEVAELLEQCLAHAQQPTSEPLPEFCRTKPSVFWRPRFMMALISLLAFAGLGLSFWLRRPVESIPVREPAEADTSVVVTVETPQSPTDPELLWDAPTDQIQQLVFEEMQFESRVDSVWNRIPITVLTDDEPSAPSNSHTEPVR